MIIKNGIILDNGFEFILSDMQIRENKIFKIGNLDQIDNNIVDCSDKYVVPGLIDMHIHGSCGYDFCDNVEDNYEHISKYLANNGITSFLFTTVTLPESELNIILNRMGNFINSNNKFSYPHGIYLEGPFCSKEKKGAQNEKYIVGPDVDMFQRLDISSKKNIKIVTIAPELDNSRKFIERFKSEKIISMAHTNATYQQAVDSISYGITHATHMYNAMTGFSHRDPGVVGAILDSNITAELICDGIHVDNSVIRVTYKMLGRDRLILISDSMSASGMGDGEYYLGEQKVYIKDRKATLADGTIAGSATNLMECMKIAHKSGLSLENAIRCATINPARVIGVDSYVGSLEEGKLADFLILNKDLSIDSVYIKGEKVV